MRSTIIKKGSVQLIPFPFTDLSGKKLRPCVVLAQEGDDITVVFITSTKPKGNKWLPIIPSTENGIKQLSYIRYAKIATLDSKLSLGELGTVGKKEYLGLVGKIVDFLN